MSAGTYKMLCEQGATFLLNLTWKDSAGAAINLTGFTAKMDVRDTKGAATAALTLSTANGRITLGGAAGTIMLVVDAGTTGALTPGQYVYDLELTSGGGQVTRLLEGFFIVDGQVTV